LKEVKVAFIGCGGIASAHAQRLSKIEGVKLVGGTDVDKNKQVAFSGLTGASFYSDVHGMLEAAQPDAVYVCTPPFARGLEVEAIEKGIPVFFEKPVALTVQKAAEIRSALRKRNSIHSVGYMWRYLDVTDRAMEELKKSGPAGMAIGQWIDPFGFPLEHWWLHKDMGGGQVLEQTTHVFDLARYLIGDITRVSAEIDNIMVKRDRPNMTAEDFSAVTMRFRSGAIGVVYSSCASQNTFSGTALRIIARGVVLEHTGHGKTLRVMRKDHVEEIRSQMDPLLEEDRVFIGAVRTGDMSAVRSSFDDAYRTLEVTVAANRAATDRAVVTLQTGD
jgi:predicted dehydrogenase